jgi:hypothetical protein
MFPRVFASGRTHRFVRLWAQASVAERAGNSLGAAELYVAAAPLAPTAQEESLALASAWIASEHAQGRTSELEISESRGSI